MMCPESTSQWYALMVKPRAEKAVSHLLQEKGYKDFLPLSVETRQWSDRVKLLALPLFPRYLFCHFDLNQRASILNTPGVQRIVGFGARPTVVPDEEIESLRKFIEAGAGPKPCEYVANGQHVEVREGALAGVRGLLVRTKTNHRVVLSVHLLQRSVYVEVNQNAIAAVAESSPGGRG